MASKGAQVKTAEKENMNKDILHHGSHLPEKCASCMVELYVGLSFYVFACHLHAVCSTCDVQELRSKQGCPYCGFNEVGTKDKGQNKLSCEARNSLPVLPTTRTNDICAASNSHLYEYPPLHQTPSVGSVTYDRSIKMFAIHLTSWSVNNTDCVIVGSVNIQGQPTLNVLSATGQPVTHVLSCGCFVISGVLVKMWLHLVSLCYRDWGDPSSTKIHLIKLDPTSSDSSLISPIITLDVNNPVYVFRKSAHLCGVLCMDGSSFPYSHGRIRLLGLDQLILPTETDPSTLQSIALWGRRTLIHLDLPFADIIDTVVVTPRGFICIVFCNLNAIRVYSGTGVYMYTLGEESLSNPWNQGELYSRVSIQCTSDNKIIVIERNANIQMYNMNSNSGKLVRRKYKWARDNENEEYTKEGKRNVYHLKDDPAGWSILRDRTTDTRTELGKSHALMKRIFGDFVKGKTRTSVMTCTRLWIVNDTGEIELFSIH